MAIDNQIEVYMRGSTTPLRLNDIELEDLARLEQMVQERKGMFTHRWQGETIKIMCDEVQYLLNRHD